MLEPGRMRTDPSGPVVVSERTLRALLAIRREKLIADLYGSAVIAESVLARMADVLPDPPTWLSAVPDAPDQALPERIVRAEPSDAATLKLALSLPASLVLLDGPIKEKAKLSFMKAEGALPLLVHAYREGHLKAVRPMVKAWQALGFHDVLPEPDQLESLWQALDQLA